MSGVFSAVGDIFSSVGHFIADPIKSFVSSGAAKAALVIGATFLTAGAASGAFAAGAAGGAAGAAGGAAGAGGALSSLGGIGTASLPSFAASVGGGAAAGAGSLASLGGIGSAALPAFASAAPAAIGAGSITPGLIGSVGSVPAGTPSGFGTTLSQAPSLGGAAVSAPAPASAPVAGAGVPAPPAAAAATPSIWEHPLVRIGSGLVSNAMASKAAEERQRQEYEYLKKLQEQRIAADQIHYSGGYQPSALYSSVINRNQP